MSNTLLCRPERRTQPKLRSTGDCSRFTRGRRDTVESDEALLPVFIGTREMPVACECRVQGSESSRGHACLVLVCMARAGRGARESIFSAHIQPDSPACSPSLLQCVHTLQDSIAEVHDAQLLLRAGTADLNRLAHVLANQRVCPRLSLLP